MTKRTRKLSAKELLERRHLAMLNAQANLLTEAAIYGRNYSTSDVWATQRYQVGVARAALRYAAAVRTFSRGSK